MTIEFQDTTSEAAPEPPVAPYAPYVPDGPLPPGLTEDAVANSYRAYGLRSKRVLLSLGIKRFIGQASARLRAAVDRPIHRAGRHDHRREHQVPPLYLALY